MFIRIIRFEDTSLCLAEINIWIFYLLQSYLNIWKVEEKLRQRATDNMLTDKLFVEINDKQTYNL